MKKINLLLVLAGATLVLSGCGGNDNSGGNGGDTPVNPVTQKHNVTFNLNYEGAKNSVVEVEDGKKVAKPADPVREGFNFVNWFDNKEGTGTAFNFETSITKDLTLFAKWEEVAKHTVTFNLNYEGAKSSTVEVQDGKKVAKPANPVREAYNFVNWFENAEGTGNAFNFDTSITKDLTLFAKWDAIYTKVAAVAATSTEPGNIEYFIDAKTGKYYKDSKLTQEVSESGVIIPATQKFTDVAIHNSMTSKFIKTDANEDLFFNFTDDVSCAVTHIAKDKTYKFEVTKQPTSDVDGEITLSEVTYDEIRNIYKAVEGSEALKVGIPKYNYANTYDTAYRFNYENNTATFGTPTFNSTKLLKNYRDHYSAMSIGEAKVASFTIWAYTNKIKPFVAPEAENIYKGIKVLVQILTDDDNGELVAKYDVSRSDFKLVLPDVKIAGKELKGYKINYKNVEITHHAGDTVTFKDSDVTESGRILIFAHYEDTPHEYGEVGTVTEEPTSLEEPGKISYPCVAEGHKDCDPKVEDYYAFRSLVNTVTTSGSDTVIYTYVNKGEVKVGDVVSVITKNNEIKNITVDENLARDGTISSRVEEGHVAKIVVPASTLPEAELAKGCLICKKDMGLLTTSVNMDIKFLSQEEGGRHMPIANGYRPQARIAFNGTYIQITATVFVDSEKETVMPGEEYSTVVTFATPFPVYKDMELFFFEGTKRVATCKVTERNDAALLVGGTDKSATYDAETKKYTLPDQRNFTEPVCGFSATKGGTEVKYKLGEVVELSQNNKSEVVYPIYVNSESYKMLGVVTNVESIVSRGTAVTIDKLAYDVQVTNPATEVYVVLKDGTIQKSIITGLTVNGAIVDSATAGTEKAQLLLRGVEASAIDVYYPLLLAK